MAKFTLKNLLDVTLKATLAVVTDNSVVKFGATFVSELSSKFDGLSDSDRKAIGQVSSEDVAEALQQIDFATRYAAIAATGTLRVEELVKSMGDELNKQSGVNEEFHAFAGKLMGSLPEIRVQLNKIDVTTTLTAEDVRILKESINAERIEVQQKFDELQLRSNQLTSGMKVVVAGSQHVIHPEVGRITSKLRQLLAEFDGLDVPVDEASDLLIRLARATVETADGKARDALVTVPAEDERIEEQATETQIEREINTKKVRGYAYYVLGEWKEALVRYERIVKLRPHRWSEKWLVANCMSRLQRHPEAMRLYEELVLRYTHIVEQDGRAELRNDLAMSQSNRGNTRSDLGQHGKAIEDFDKAIDIQTQLVENEGRTELLNDLANSHNNRGNARRKLGQCSEAIEDYDKAIDIYSQLVEGEGRAELRNYLANIHNNRGNARGDLGQHDKAIKDFDKAIGIHTKLVDGEGRAELRNDLAMSHNNRGITRGNLGQYDNAIEDFDMAIDIRTQLVEGDGRAELRNALARSHNNRGNARIDLGQHDKAIEDFDKAIGIRTQLVEGEGRTELRNDLAMSHNNRGVARRRLGQHDEAIEDCDKAIGIYSHLVEKEARRELAGNLDVVRGNRADMD